MSRVSCVFVLALVAECAQGVRVGGGVARREALAGAAAAALGATAFGGPLAALADDTSTASGLSWKVVKSGKGGQPVTGDLIAIRFKGSVAATGAVFDDIMTSAEPYYTRVGSGNVLAGVEEAVKLMHSGDVWELSIPGALAFGKQGRSASPGKPRIPADATIAFTLELVAVPGKDDEMLEELGLAE